MVFADGFDGVQLGVDLLARAEFSEHDVGVCRCRREVDEDVGLFTLRNPLEVAREDFVVDVKLVWGRVGRGRFNGLTGASGIKFEDDGVSVRSLGSGAWTKG